MVALVGLSVTAASMARGVPGALLWGILASAAAGFPLGIVQYHGIASPPPSLGPTFMQLDVAGALAPAMIPVVFVFFFLALFDSIGTLVAVGQQAGLMRGGYPAAGQGGAARRCGRHGRGRGARAPQP